MSRIFNFSAGPAALPEAVLKDVQAEMLEWNGCLLYTSPSPRDQRGSRMPSSA